MGYAEQTYKLQPDSPAALVTYGWALAMNADKVRAHQELDQLIKRGLDFSQKPAAVTLMQALDNKQVKLCDYAHLLLRC